MFRVVVSFLLTLLCLGGPGARCAWAYKPTSPEVQAMVERGRAFIEKNFGTNSHDGELGAVCVCALACFSQTANANHPLVQKAIAQIRTEAQQGFVHDSHGNYSLGLALIMLGTIDPETYRNEAMAIINAFYRRQQAFGAWTYPNDPIGDTSQTQYACLGMWMADRQGIEVKVPVMEAVCNWLLRTQTPAGAFGYKPKDPGAFDARVAQDRDTMSMSCAGGGSLYVCGELLGFIEDPKANRKRMSLPPALRPVPKPNEGQRGQAVDRGRWEASIKDANNWIDRNAKVENNGSQQQYYYMYGVERYWAFREIAIASPQEEPGWYNAGVDFCRARQGDDGAWGGENGKTVDTAFAMLFLLRSSKKTITRIQLEQGRLRGGKGLQENLTNARVDGTGKVVAPDAGKPVNELLAMLEDKNNPQADFVSAVPEKIELAPDPKDRKLQLERLRRMVVNGSFQARLTAVKTLGATRDMENAPALIYALSDPDFRVARAADDGLKFLSRNFRGVGFVVKDNERPERHAWQEAQKKWTSWLLSVKPDAQLLD